MSMEWIPRMEWIPCNECVCSGECDYQAEEDKEGCYLGEREEDEDE